MVDALSLRRRVPSRKSISKSRKWESSGTPCLDPSISEGSYLPSSQVVFICLKRD